MTNFTDAPILLQDIKHAVDIIDKSKRKHRGNLELIVTFKFRTPEDVHPSVIKFEKEDGFKSVKIRLPKISKNKDTEQIKEEIRDTIPLEQNQYKLDLNPDIIGETAFDYSTEDYWYPHVRAGAISSMECVSLIRRLAKFYF